MAGRPLFHTPVTCDVTWHCMSAPALLPGIPSLCFITFLSWCYWPNNCPCCCFVLLNAQLFRPRFLPHFVLFLGGFLCLHRGFKAGSAGWARLCSSTCNFVSSTLFPEHADSPFTTREGGCSQMKEPRKCICTKEIYSRNKYFCSCSSIHTDTDKFVNLFFNFFIDSLIHFLLPAFV